MTPSPPDSGPRSAPLRASSVILLALLMACGGKDKNENRIKPILATLHIDAFTGTPDPALFLERASTTGDLVTIDVKLHNGTGNPIAFDAFTLELTYDYTLIQVGDVFEVNPAVLGDCNGGITCSPNCLNNSAEANEGLTVDANGKAHFLLGVAAQPTCPTASLTSDTTLVTLGFIAATTIPEPNPPNDPNQAKGRISLISGPGRGDCEILDNLVDLGIPCIDGNAYLTAAR